MAAMITSSRMPEPRESARKTRSPGRVAPRAARSCAPWDVGGVGGGASVCVDMSIRSLRSAEPDRRAAPGGGAPDGAARLGEAGRTLGSAQVRDGRTNLGDDLVGDRR